MGLGLTFECVLCHFVPFWCLWGVHASIWTVLPHSFGPIALLGSLALSWAGKKWCKKLALRHLMRELVLLSKAVKLGKLVCTACPHHARPRYRPAWSPGMPCQVWRSGDGCLGRGGERLRPAAGALVSQFEHSLPRQALRRRQEGKTGASSHPGGGAHELHWLVREALTGLSLRLARSPVQNRAPIFLK